MVKMIGVFIFIYKIKIIIEYIRKIKNSKSMSGIVRMLKNDKKIFNFVVNRTKYLDIDVSINERLFNIKNDIFQKTQCPICSSDVLEWNFKYKRYKNTCNNKKCKNTFFVIIFK
jgi:hypothetical protein